jgi:hypothetical protein
MRPRNERSVPRNKTFKGRIFTRIRVRVNKGPRSATESFTSQDLGFVRINRDDMHTIVRIPDSQRINRRINWKECICWISGHSLKWCDASEVVGSSFQGLCGGQRQIHNGVHWPER